ncbi:HEAT repeat domain-containing protein [Paenibacillus sp. KQZ6P-2]|uniref:HEAT repeat domain-containing protein n=1 Tax=Paenibacillus mangrovi TaxID=2931978 RepID=A0A9X2B5A3_9BACL|nr:HEAT repeat domain-containing protein [Paenibacillus mangrovi]MCJ8014820.1 HEAT repeat domain-containing protein [Paenibacillus mangrovi]
MKKVLAKVNFDRAEPIIRQELHSKNAACRLLALQFIKWYMPQGEGRFTEDLIALLPLETDEQAFRFMTMILNDMGVEMLSLMPFFTHPNKEFRNQALYQAGKSTAKAEYVTEFIAALEDADPVIQHTALQALNGVTDARLLPVFERLLQQHKTNKDCIRSNVRGLLEEYPFVSMEQVERELPSSLIQVKGILRKIIDPYQRK